MAACGQHVGRRGGHDFADSAGFVHKLLLREENERVRRLLLEPSSDLRHALRAEMAGALPESDEGHSGEAGGWEYYSRTPARRDLPLICRRPMGGASFQEQVLLDLSALADSHGYAAVGAFAGSPDGRRFAYTLDLEGSEEWRLVIAEAASDGGHDSGLVGSSGLIGSIGRWLVGGWQSSGPPPPPASTLRGVTSLQLGG